MGAFDGLINSVVIPDISRDRHALAACSAAGINLLGKQRVKLTQIGIALQSAIAQTEKATKLDEFVSQSLLAANLTKASCDAFLEMAGALGKAAGLKNVDVVGKGLSAGVAVAGSTASSMAGQKTDWVATGNSVLKATNAKYGKADMKDLADLQMLKVDVINAAIRGDSAKALQAVFLKYLPKIGQMSLKYMKEEVKSNWLGAVSAVANAGYNYSKALEKAFDGRLKDRDDIEGRKEVLSSMRQQMGVVIDKIKQIDTIMADCAGQVQRLR